MPKYLVLEWPFDGEEDESELNFTEGSLSIVRDMAHDRCASEHRVIVIAEYIDTVRPGAPVWDSSTPAQPAEAEPERDWNGFRVGDSVLANPYNIGWKPGAIQEIQRCSIGGQDYGILFDTEDGLPEYLNYPADRFLWCRLSEIKRRPAPAPKPLAFGQMVKITSGDRYDGLRGVVISSLPNSDGEWYVQVEEKLCRWYSDKQVTPI